VDIVVTTVAVVVAVAGLVLAVEETVESTAVVVAVLGVVVVTAGTVGKKACVELS
jgi:hypothetical protein